MKYDEVAQLIQRIKDPFHRTWAFLGVAGGYIETGQKDEGSQLLSRVLEIAETMENVYEKSNISARVAARHAEAGQYDAATQLAEAVQDAPFRAWALLR